MAGSLTHKETNVPTAQELQEQYDLSSYGKEESESGEENNKLTEDQVIEIDRMIEEANEKKDGTVSKLDKAKYVDYLLNSNPEKRKEAIEDLPEHLEKKAVHLQRYLDSVGEYFSIDGVIDAEGKQVLNDEGKELIKGYKKKTGLERQEAEKTLRTLIKLRTQEKKSYEELLQDSPHFSENGQRTTRAKELFEIYQNVNSSEKLKMKKQLIQEVRRCEYDERQCESLYKAANNCYENGEFTRGEKILGFMLRICQRYPDSPRMQVLRDWNERDLANMKDHTEHQKKIDELIFLRDNYTSFGDLETALRYSDELLSHAQYFLNYTVDRNGAEVPRNEKYKSKYLQDLYQDAWSQASALNAVKTREERKREQAQQLKKSLQRDYTTSNEADDHTTLLGIAEEEARKRHSEQRTAEKDMLKTQYIQTEDIDNLSEEDLNTQTKEEEREVAVNFDRDNQHGRLMKLKEAEEVNTGMVRGDGRAIVKIEEIESLVGKKTETYMDGFAQRAQAADLADREVIDQLQENMQQNIDSGDFGRSFTDETRKSGLDVVRFGDDFDRSQREVGEMLVEQIEEEEEEDDGKIINLAEQVRGEHLQHRPAA